MGFDGNRARDAMLRLGTTSVARLLAALGADDSRHPRGNAAAPCKTRRGAVPKPSSKVRRRSGSGGRRSPVRAASRVRPSRSGGGAPRSPSRTEDRGAAAPRSPSRSGPRRREISAPKRRVGAKISLNRSHSQASRVRPSAPTTIRCAAPPRSRAWRRRGRRRCRGRGSAPPRPRRGPGGNFRDAFETCIGAGAFLQWRESTPACADAHWSRRVPVADREHPWHVHTRGLSSYA